MQKLRWPVHPHPVKEECILSWLTRIAHCYDFTLDEFLKVDLGFQGNVNELNIKTPEWLLTLLSERSGISEKDIYAMTASSYVPFLLDPFEIENSDFELYVRSFSVLYPWYRRKRYLPKKSWKPWFSEGWSISKACPICIKSKKISSILLPWSLPTILSCPLHKCYLRECDIYQGSFCCWKKESEPICEASFFVQIMDQRTWSAITTGEVILPQRTVHCAIWFRLLRALIDEIHIAPSYLKKRDAEIINEIWASLGFESRAGRKVWSPFENLPFEIKKNTLIAVAKTIEKIENETIYAFGKEAHLFSSKPLIKEDQTIYSSLDNIESESPWLKAFNIVKELLETAKQNQSEAISLRNFLLFGKSDSESILKVENILLDAGVPIEFLVT